VTEVTGVTDLFLTSRAGRVDRRGTRCTSCLPGAMHQHLAKRRARAIDLTQSKISGCRTGEYVADEHADKTAASEQRIARERPFGQRIRLREGCPMTWCDGR
jgi:hypothetical protein